ncbi:MAG: prolyl oligopeptidase family serine peptidase [Alphaproteobacteria bacterium]|nr:prolyl oligopeptidase family serine peptidase [Alphaproteobacteria bacterium]
MLTRIAVIAVALATLGCGCAVGDRIELEHDGSTRNYFLVVPEGVPADAPLVLALHGGGPAGTHKGRRMGRYTGLADLAAEEGFVAAFPSSLEGNWNDGREIENQFVTEDTDDVGFIAAVVADVASRASIDPARVYVTGESNGGFMTQRLLCERSDLFAAGVSFIATMPDGYTCTPAQPVGVMFVLGTEDPLVPYEGGDIGEGDRGAAIAADAAMAFWAAANGCQGEPTAEALPDVDPDDGSTVTHERWPGCAAPVERVVIDGGGHTYPSGPQYLPERLVGTVNRDVRGQDLFWGFVSGQSAPSSP